MTKKEKELAPEIEKVESNNSRELQQLAQDIKDSTTVVAPQDNNNDSYFRNVLNKLFDNENISSKTEYLNTRENFAGTKLDFYAKFGNMPYLKEFLRTFEIKRVSLERKGRKEILLGLQERRQEQEEQRMNNMRSFFNV